MLTETNRGPLRTYFYGSVGPKLIMMETPVCAVLLAMIADSAKSLLALLLIGEAVGVIWWFVERYAMNGTLEAQYDRCLETDWEAFSQMALQKLGIVSEQISLIQPIKVSGPYDDFEEQRKKRKINTLISGVITLAVIFLFFQLIATIGISTLGLLFAFSAVGDSNGVLILSLAALAAIIAWAVIKVNVYNPRMIFKYGADEKFRYSMVRAHIFLFSENQVYVYRVSYDICTGNIYEEATFEYFYQDIDCVATGVEHRRIQHRKKQIEKTFEYFRLIVTSGTETSAFADCENSILETQIMGMRNLLREKKEKIVLG